MTTGMFINEKNKRKKGGRPRKKLKSGPKPTLDLDQKTLDRIELIAKDLITQKEASGKVGVSRSTFHNFLNNHPEAMEAWHRGRDEGKRDFRQLQIKAAKDGSVPMLIHLGKHYLDQHDKSEQKIDITDSRTTEQLESGIVAIARQIDEVRTGNKPKSVLIEHSTEPVTDLSPLSPATRVPRSGQDSPGTAVDGSEPDR